MAQCPECAGNVPTDGAMIGEIVRCPDCSAELEVTNLDPPTVEIAPQTGEDWGE